MVNGREERVYIVVQAARRRHTRSGRAKPFCVIHRSSVYIPNWFVVRVVVSLYSY